jgi:RimJ/RimL family protein N-acetyltransferase
VPLLPDVLSAGAIDLHRWRPAHGDELLGAVVVSFPELHRWMPWAATMPAADDLAAVLRDGEAAFEADREWVYVLREVASDEVVGAAGLHPRSGPGSIEIGYWVRSDRTGRGYATAAARALTAAALTRLGSVERVEIRMDRANRASAAVPAKLGFRLLGGERRDLLAPGHSGEGLVWVLARMPNGSHGQA